MASLFQPVADATRVFLNSAMGGLPEIAITDAGRAQAERNRVANAEARERLGLTGDALNAAGFIAPAAGVLKAIKGLKYLPTLAKAAGTGAKAAVKAAPVVERAVARKVVPGYAARESALARLDLPAMRTVSGSIGSAVTAHPVRTAVGATVLGAGTAASHNARTYDAQHMPQLQQSIAAEPVRAAPAAPASAQPVTRERLLDAYDNAHPEWRGEGTVSGQPTLQEALAAAAMSGKVPTRQLMAMGEFYDHLQPRGSTRPPSVRDQILGQLVAGLQGQTENSIKAGMDPGQAQMQYLSGLERLLKLEPDYTQLGGGE